MIFKEVELISKFFDEYSCLEFYLFRTVPQIDHGDWAVAETGDTFYDLVNDNITQIDHPQELIHLVDYITES